ncbi:DUF4244 domain-containing protein [Actinokineospora pegani]|uniref:DUF4244 domain-containing protein n=1 Tax=Actinokineospora pegani TaxID=2654637 RepID=UPI0012EB03DB|nr:DUF4244 domain-containing protein [Actinokineospora pegani]
MNDFIAGQDRAAITVEYAVLTVGAAAIAAVLGVVANGEWLLNTFKDLVDSALDGAT